jgi:hypothetical protein
MARGIRERKSKKEHERPRQLENTGILKNLYRYCFRWAAAPSTPQAIKRSPWARAGLLEPSLVHLVGGIAARPGGNNRGGNHHTDKCKGN